MKGTNSNYVQVCEFNGGELGRLHSLDMSETSLSKDSYGIESFEIRKGCIFGITKRQELIYWG